MSKVRLETKMLRRVLKQIVIRNQAQTLLNRASSSVSTKIEIKINQENETFELHDAEVDDATSGKQKKFEFPFVYLRDNCQVGLPHLRHHDRNN